MPAKTFTVELERVSFTNRRQCVEWVEDARGPETRARRVSSTVERARDGKPHR